MEVPGPVSSRVVEHAPFGPMEQLDHERLLAEQPASLESPRRRPGLARGPCSW